MSGFSIGEQEAAELSDLLALARGEDGLALPWPFVRRLKHLIGCDALSVVGMNSTSQTHYLAQGIDDIVDDEEYEDADSDQSSTEDDPFWLHYWSSEPCCYPDVAGDYASVTLLSDFYTRRQWHDTGMYVDCFRWAGIEHELMMCLPDGTDQSLRLLALRGTGPDFGERERFLLRLLRPHIAEAYRAAVRRRSGPAKLTPRQLEILQLVEEGCTNRQVARRMRLSEGTVRTHLEHIFTRLGVTSRTAAVGRISDPSIRLTT